MPRHALMDVSRHNEGQVCRSRMPRHAVNTTKLLQHKHACNLLSSRAHMVVAAQQHMYGCEASEGGTVPSLQPSLGRVILLPSCHAMLRRCRNAPVAGPAVPRAPAESRQWCLYMFAYVCVESLLGPTPLPRAYGVNFILIKLNVLIHSSSADTVHVCAKMPCLCRALLILKLCCKCIESGHRFPGQISI